MGRIRRSRRGFTLTEVLMAIGILGIGLTMVASVFPVAVDQSRRSRETTMAALCARSVMATMRAKRDEIIPLLRNNAKDKTVEISTNGWYVKGKDRVYNPDSFLYEQDRAYKTTDSSSDQYPTWLAGNYYPVVLATPISNISPPTTLGPWRITILVYKATGAMPDHLNTLSTGGKYLAAWSTNGGQQGAYIVDWRPADATNFYGQAYLVDRFTAGASHPADSIYLASASVSTTANVGGYPMPTSYNVYSIGSTTRAAVSVTGATGLPGWVSMPGAIAAFHTIIGD